MIAVVAIIIFITIATTMIWEPGLHGPLVSRFVQGLFYEVGSSHPLTWSPCELLWLLREKGSPWEAESLVLGRAATSLQRP